ncbi:succinylglutamate desuccinylase/aspartoacylase family protein [Roseateles sp. BYS180W]|uniref:Succinylglutamate desuccinylase/aspartoacylase family protein n=1 Tax=Roseateles rivi TaxID=3299028 RepID=A0ABW7FVH7_9BURK
MQHFQSIRLDSPHSGPRLIVTGAVHGNEVCGTAAIRRVLAEFEQGQLQLLRGSLTLVPITNPRAYALGQRGADRNLNRRLRPNPQPQQYEDHVANWLCPLLAQHEVLLDLHSFQSPGQAFVMVGPPNNSGSLQPFAQAERELALAKVLGVQHAVDGWLQTYAQGVATRRAWADILPEAQRAQFDLDEAYGVGTTEAMRAMGGLALTLECGQHQDPAAPDVGWRAIKNTLVHLGMIEGPAPAVQSMQGLSLFAVFDKAHDQDHFARPWVSFDRVHTGQLIGHRANGQAVHASCDGAIVFPNPQAKAGQEWFYLARETERFN